MLVLSGEYLRNRCFFPLLTKLMISVQNFHVLMKHVSRPVFWLRSHGFFSHFAEFVKSVMAENLPFSIANILRSDFPHSSRISKVPSIEHLTPSRGRRQALFFRMRFRPVQVLPRRSYNERRASDGRSLYTVCSPQMVEKDVLQNLGDVQGQKPRHLTERMKEGNF